MPSFPNFIVEDFDFNSNFNEHYSPLAKNMLRLLSQNSRISITEMSEKLGVSRKTIGDKLKKIEKELEIKYTLELDEIALGLTNPHLVLVKFSKKPDYASIKKILSESHIPQIVAKMDGTYDLFIYANAESASEYVYWDKTTQITLSKYRAIWHSSDLAFRHLGFFPIRNELLERLKIPEVYKRLILLLNENVRMSMKEMSKRMEMKPSTLAYNLEKLLKTGYIKRFTITTHDLPDISIMSIFNKYIIGEGFEEDSMKMRKEITFRDDKMPMISRCLLSAQLIGSYDFVFMGAYDSSKVGMDHLVKYCKERFKKHSIKIMYGTVSDMLIGNLPIRNLDSKTEFNMIRWVPGISPKVERPQEQ